MLSKERRAEIETWAHRRYGNGKNGGYHGRLSQMLVDVLSSHDELEAEVERLTPDAKLGAAVGRLPDGATIGPQDDRWFICDNDGVTQGRGDTPEDALAAAGLMGPTDGEVAP